MGDKFFDWSQVGKRESFRSSGLAVNYTKMHPDVGA